MLMVLSSERYEKMVSEAAVEYAQAAAAARAENVRVVEQRAELDKLMAEQAALMRQVADFEAGKIHLSAEEWVGSQDRARWLEIMIRGQRTAVRTAESQAMSVGAGCRHVDSKYRNVLETMLAEDVRLFLESQRHALEAVLRG